MSSQLNQETEIFAFEQGQCILLKDFQNKEENGKFDLGDQMQNLIEMFGSLTQTVNQNAQVLKQLGKKVNQNESHFWNFLNQNNANYLRYYSDGLQKKSQSICEENFMDFFLERNDALQKEMLKSIESLKLFREGSNEQIELLKNQQKQLFNQFYEQDNQQQPQIEETGLEQLRFEIIGKLEKLRNQIFDCCTKSYADQTFQELKFNDQQIQAQISEKLTDIQEQLDNLELNRNDQQLQDNNDVWKKINELSDLSKVFIQKNENYDQMLMDFQNNELKQKKHSKLLKKLIKNKMPQQNQKRISALENLVFKEKNNNVEKIEINQKHIKKLFDQLSLKIDKEQFFEFVSENFVRLKDYLNFQKDVLRGQKDQEQQIVEQDKNLKQLKFDVSDKIDDCHHNFEIVSKKAEQNYQNILKIMSLESNGERMYHSLEKRIEKLKEFFIDTYSQKLNCLTSAQGLKCLSCGERDLPFPPQSKFLQDENKNVYQFKENQDCNKRIDSAMTKNTLNSSNQNLKSQQKNKFKLTTKSSKLKSQNMQSYNSLTNQNYMIGPQVFNKQHNVVEHYFKTHLPVDQVIEKELYRKRPQRPQTSIPKFN